MEMPEDAKGFAETRQRFSLIREAKRKLAEAHALLESLLASRDTLRDCQSAFESAREARSKAKAANVRLPDGWQELQIEAARVTRLKVEQEADTISKQQKASFQNPPRSCVGLQSTSFWLPTPLKSPK